MASPWVGHVSLSFATGQNGNRLSPRTRHPSVVLEKGRLFSSFSLNSLPPPPSCNLLEDLQFAQTFRPICCLWLTHSLSLPSFNPKALHFPTLSLQSWRWRQYVSLKLWYQPWRLHGTRTQNSVSIIVFTVLHLRRSFLFITRYAILYYRLNPWV
jgi:hypothetical protein